MFESLLHDSYKSSKKILEEWREKCRMIGEPITLDINGEKKYGIFYDLDANGFLILKSGDKIEKILNKGIDIHVNDDQIFINACKDSKSDVLNFLINKISASLSPLYQLSVSLTLNSNSFFANDLSLYHSQFKYFKL